MVKLYLNPISISAVSYNISLFAQSFDLPNSLLFLSFAIFFIILLNKALSSEGSSVPIPAHIGEKIKDLESQIEVILNSPAGPSDISRLIELIGELLQLQSKYKFVSAEQEANIRALLEFLMASESKNK